MKKKPFLFSFFMLLSGILFAATAVAQGAKPKASPPATSTGKIGNATITVNYSSPAVKERQIWGGLVPYGKVWRAGANEATTLETDQDLTVEGKLLPAGKYSIFAIPGEDQWTVIFNKQTGQWGTRYDESEDFLRVTAKPVKSKSFNERLAYEVTPKGLVLRWENLEVPVRMSAKKAKSKA
ncbi:DUF2911 domain-containing protein [Botryobacter ruber]|uniref:DUF2911 domain-containing protein n=1 Tax=Botryobacter ruber TaxID=2171629 RepID=UPI000E0B47C0|nr:DUF2911 domain-containing protein [Botryobacter ruber]